MTTFATGGQPLGSLARRKLTSRVRGCSEVLSRSTLVSHQPMAVRRCDGHREADSAGCRCAAALDEPRGRLLHRSGQPCQAPAMPNGRCRMHGGKSPGAPKGNRNALKHGGRSAETIAMRREVNDLVRVARRTIAEIEQD